PPPPPPPPPVLPPIPDPASAEFQANWGLAAIHADVAFNAGANGKGVTVAVIDTGVDPTQFDLQGAVSPQSTDVNAARDKPVGSDNHATLVAGVIAARYNGVGTIGVAYDSTILSIRADNGHGSFEDVDTAAGVEYAIAHGARVINLSIGGDSPASPVLQAALSDAVKAGVVVAVSAGNAGGPDPQFPAQLAADPRYQGSLVAVGSISQNLTISSFSNRAGIASQGYIAAPGENITTGCDAIGCFVASGTSFSAPHVAGALADLLQAFPNLTGAQAVNLLLVDADPAGAHPGNDAVYGRGILDLTKAFQPMGALSVATGAGMVQVAVRGSGLAAMPGSAVGQAFGDAVRTNAGLVTFGYDSYRRKYVVDLADVYRPGQRQALIMADPSQRTTQASFALPAGARLSLASGGPLVTTDERLSARGLAVAAQPAFTQVSASLGGLSFSAWQGRGGASPTTGASRDAFQTVAAPDRVMMAALDVGRWSFAAEGGSGERSEPLSTIPVRASRYLRTSADYRGDGFAAHIAVGSLLEPLGPLGSNLAGPFALPASTGFVTLGGETGLAHGMALYGEASLGRTRFSGAFLHADKALSSSWRLGLSGSCARAWGVCSHFGVEVSQPLRFEAGAIDATLAAAPANYLDPLTLTDRRIPLAPSGRQIDLGLFADKDLRALGFLRLRAAAVTDDGNRAAAPLGLGLLATWRYGF
ncbi:MAG: S8 family peptidase, partial [Caulobacterales bacterium]